MKRGLSETRKEQREGEATAKGRKKEKGGKPPVRRDESNGKREKKRPPPARTRREKKGKAIRNRKQPVLEEGTTRKKENTWVSRFFHQRKRWKGPGPFGLRKGKKRKGPHRLDKPSKKGKEKGTWQRPKGEGGPN